MTDDYIVIITGASDNHFNTSKNFLKSLQKSDMKFKCYYYDLGLNENNLNNLKSEFNNILIKKFDYSKYPNYFNININAGEYSWKPAILYEISQIESGIILWCDAGNLLTGSLQNLYNVIDKNMIYSPTSHGNIKVWTHIKVLDYFNLQDDANFLKNNNRNGAILGFNLKNKNVLEFVFDFYKHVLTKDAICPEGSSRDNHRQDQALFTILYYKNVEKCNIIPENNYISLSIHNDIGS
jgi:hypothetical protein